MNRNTFKWRIFKYNVIVIVGLIAFVTLVFNFSVRVYIENGIREQLTNISSRIGETALRKGPDFFNGVDKLPPPMPDGKMNEKDSANTKGSADSGGRTAGSSDTDRQGQDKSLEFYFRLDRTLRETLSVLNADYILLDTDKKVINIPEGDYFNIPEGFVDRVSNELSKMEAGSREPYLSFNYSGVNYIVMVNSVSDQNNFGLGWIITYSNLHEVNQLQWGINTILLIILLLSAAIIAFFSSLAAKKISEPISSLSLHIGEIAERNFGTKIQMPVDMELQGLVNNINVMSEKLETYDKAQKTFLQNASHEFRTPLMSIQSYAEGIKYEVVDINSAVDVIIGESKRMTHLVEDLLYLSRLDAIEESYRFDRIIFSDLINSCIERMNGIAAKSNIAIQTDMPGEKLEITVDEEKLSRAVTNVLSNCIRYAEKTVSIDCKIMENCRLKLSISDDGPGFDPNELPHIFERFYKGKKGNFGLGLAIAKNVIERHGGVIMAENSGKGALFVIELPL